MKTPQRTPRKTRPSHTPAARKTPARKPVRAPKPAEALCARVEKVRAILESKKGENVVIMRITDVSSVSDYMILCSGLNTPHLRALADEVVKQLRLENPPAAPHRRAGSAESEWLVLDYLDFIVHLFTPSLRSYYALERLWKDAPVV